MARRSTSDTRGGWLEGVRVTRGGGWLEGVRVTRGEDG